MEKKEEQNAWKDMYRRWGYMAVAIAASLLLFWRPVFNFQDDKGIMYVRSFSMDQKTFYVTQTELDTGAAQVTATMSVKGLYVCNWAMLIGAALCLLCFFSDRWRIALSVITAFSAGAYYLLMIYYALRMADGHYATLYPNLMAVAPAIVLHMMLLTRRSIIQTIVAESDDDEEED